jgi:hypothetical protein
MEVIMKKLVVLATAVVALAVGTATVLTLSSTANPKLGRNGHFSENSHFNLLS